MTYPMIFNIKNSLEQPTDYYVDDGCNVFKKVGSEFIPLTVTHRKKDGRPIVSLNIDGKKKNYLVYRLLMRAITNMPISEFDKYVVDHIDCNTYHNETNNFELITQEENMRRAGINNLMPFGENHFNSKYSDDKICSICEDICNGLSRNEIIEKENVNGQLIDDIRSGRSHKMISEKYLDKGFVYKTYDRSEKVQKAERVCELLQAGYKVTEIDSMTNFGYNFILAIKDKRTFKDISIKYNF